MDNHKLTEAHYNIESKYSSDKDFIQDMYDLLTRQTMCTKCKYKTVYLLGSRKYKADRDKICDTCKEIV